MLFGSKILVPFVSFLLLAACSGETTPSTPIETFKTYTKAIKQKDTTTMKLLLSAETLKMHELEAKAQSVTVDDIVKRETLFSEGQTTVKLRNEKIDGETATLEVENSFGAWETVPFIKEDDVWKIDKKGYADRLMQEIEQNNQQLDDIIDQGKQP
ncbi:MAG: hypothetical protein ACR2M8_05140 [Pyrinomonadaceae bacterium]